MGAADGIGTTLQEETVLDSGTGRIGQCYVRRLPGGLNADVPDVDVVFVGKPIPRRKIGRGERI